MKLYQLGNGGGFDFDQVASSFLIELENGEKEYILFDCGRGVLKKLQKMEESEETKNIFESLAFVFVSHMHDDHIGELSSLILYRYFVLGKMTTILTNNKIQENLKQYLELTCSTKFEGSREKRAYMFDIRTNTAFISHNILNNTVFNINDFQSFTDSLKYSSPEAQHPEARKKYHKRFSVLSTPAFHPGIEANGMLLVDLVLNQGIYISGDTKAIPEIEHFIDKVREQFPDISLKLFHDFSYNDVPTRNVHACKTDVETEYSADFRACLNFYHTGEKKLYNLQTT